MLVFCLTMLWFYWHNPYYPAARIQINGTVSKPYAHLIIRWNSGHGLNGYEMNKYFLQPLPKGTEKNGIKVSIERTGRKNPASANSDVILNNIQVDGHRYHFPKKGIQGIKIQKNGFLNFAKNHATLNLTLHPEYHLHLEFLTFNHAGFVQINMAGEIKKYDLYTSNNLNHWSLENEAVIDHWFASPDGKFSISMHMPRYPVGAYLVSSKAAFSISSFIITTADGQTLVLKNGFRAPLGMVYQMKGINKKLKRYFQSERFSLQLIFSLLTTWLFLSIWSFICRFDGPKAIFFENKRYLFWIMLLISFGVYCVWLTAFWPGVASTDSLKIWRAAQIPGMYLRDHPPLNVIFYQYLIGIWNNMAVVPIFQNLCTSLLIAYIFFSFYRWKLPLYILIPGYLLLVFSLPVGMYTMTLWKDIPFALLTVFIGFKISNYYFCARSGNLHISKKEWLVFILLILALGGIRYNGVVYVLLIPFLLVTLRIIRIRRPLPFILVSALFVGAVLFCFLKPNVLGKRSFVVSQTKMYLHDVEHRLSSGYLLGMGKKYLGILNVDQTKTQWDLIHLCLYGRYNNNFLRQVRWNDVYPYLPLPRKNLQKILSKKLMDIYWKTYKVPWVYLTWNPVFMLILLLVLPFFIKKLPMTAVFSFFIVVQAAALVFFDIFNWRYYYFLFLALYFLIPMIGADISRGRTQVSK